jgi:transposase
MVLRTGSGFWPCWITHHRLGILTGRRRCWRGSWWTSTSSISGGSCVPPLAFHRLRRRNLSASFAQKIDLSGRKSWCQSTDPDFVPKAADIVGLYMAPPTNAVVLSVDEKPSIQALERAQGYLKLPNGRAMIGQSHDYKRHGTSTLFAALNVGTGQIIGKHYKRRRRIEFRDFMNRVVKQYEGKEIHVILDNLSTHKPKRDLWLARHPNVHFHYTPTHTSWLNQIEIWFSILASQSLKGASFGSVAELVAHIESFINSYNEDARPSVWTKSAVHQKRLKPCFAV